MAKEIKYNMGKNIFEMASRPLRSKQEVILLLLYTIRMFEVEELKPESKNVQVAIVINKMNRIIYILEKKIFSIQFPFFVETQGDKIARIYDPKTGLEIDSMLVSALIGIFEKSFSDSFPIDSFLDEILYWENILHNVNNNQIWEIVKSFSDFDLGYIRYDCDEKHQNGLLHPANHLDICLDMAATFKIGLEKSINYEIFKDILDTTTDCFFLKKLNEI